MATLKRTVTEEYPLVECSQCGIRFAVPAAWVQQRREDHTSWYCPNGHSQHWPQETDAEKWRREAQRLKQQLAQKDDEIAAAELRTRKLTKRVSAGVCPCCHRTFRQLALHMKKQHPQLERAHG